MSDTGWTPDLKFEHVLCVITIISQQVVLDLCQNPVLAARHNSIFVVSHTVVYIRSVHSVSTYVTHLR